MPLKKPAAPCGSPVYLDTSSGGDGSPGSGCYRCSSCGAVLGSIGIPRVCQELERWNEQLTKNYLNIEAMTKLLEKDA